MAFINTGLFVFFFKENYKQKSSKLINIFRITITLYSLMSKTKSTVYCLTDHILFD